jgi:hypothetical protein
MPRQFNTPEHIKTLEAENTRSHQIHEKKEKTEAPQPVKLIASCTTSSPSLDNQPLATEIWQQRVSTTTGEPPNPLPRDLPTLSTEIQPEPRPLPGSLPLAPLVVFGPRLAHLDGGGEDGVVAVYGR